MVSAEQESYAGIVFEDLLEKGLGESINTAEGGITYGNREENL